jgi:hypothetical protein
MSATDFTSPPSEKWREIVEGSSSVEEMRSRMKKFQAANGIIEIERGFEYGGKLTKEAEDAVSAAVPSEAAAPSQRRDTCIRVLYLGGDSKFEIVGPDENSLDMQEEKLRALYRRPR